MTPTTTPARLHLKKDEMLEIDWQDGHQCTFTLTYLRSRCPCAACKATREEQAKSKSRLNILPGNYSGALTAVSAERVGNYAIRIDWSDNHGSGIYSFDYLREDVRARLRNDDRDYDNQRDDCDANYPNEGDRRNTA